MATQGKIKSTRTKNTMFIEGTHDKKATRSTLVHAKIPYIPPCREGAPRVRVPMNQRYIIPLSKMPKEVIVEGNFPGRVPELRFVDHDFHDLVKFPNFRPQYYMRIVPTKEVRSSELQFLQ